MHVEANAFPIAPLLPAIRDSLRANPRLVLEAPPGAGKTTQVPPALLDEPWLAGGSIVMLEPRRIAARAAAEFMAAQRSESVGQTVGYRIRFESRVSAATRIIVVTEGILTRMLQDDPALAGVGAIIFDEFHERHLAGDLGAALALDVQGSLRPDLRLVVMSATLEGTRVAEWFSAPILRSEGRTFPVQVEYPSARREETDGDVLVFLPGRREIARMQRMLAARGEGPLPGNRLIEILPLHGELAPADQHAALAVGEADVRRVILATNLAESSVTVPGVRAVVDTGLAREPRFDPNSGFTRLATINISRASADQRAGRAGRTAPGNAYRLWPESRRLDAARTPEIGQAELSGFALELAAWGVGADVGALSWLDLPPEGALAQARELLQGLGALAGDLRITPLGRNILELGAAPRFGAAVFRAPEPQHALVADLLSLLESRSPLQSAAGDDLRARVAALHRYRDRGMRAAGDADAAALAAIEQIARGWRKRLGLRHGASGTPDGLAIGNLLLHAFPDRAARRDDKDPYRYRLANGRGVRLREDSMLYGEPWLVIAEARFEAGDSLVLAAAPFEPEHLRRDYADRIAEVRVLRTNESDVVEAFEEVRFGAIVLERRAVPARPEDALAALLVAIRSRGIAALPWSDGTSRLRARVAWLRRAMPEGGLPDVSDQALLDSLETWLAPALAGKRKLERLSAAELSNTFASLLDWPLRKFLDEAAPDAVTVPSGMTRKLEYALEAGGDEVLSPVLAVKLQELFGLAETPLVARGRMPVTLHLLSPAGRPIQVTQDLRGFWDRTYPEVKKELKGRYPKHPWPDDPWSATPTHRAKKRS